MARLAADILRQSHVTDVFACLDCDWTFHAHHDPEASRDNGYPRSAAPNAARLHLRGNPDHVVKRHKVLHQTLRFKGDQ